MVKSIGSKNCGKFGELQAIRLSFFCQFLQLSIECVSLQITHGEVYYLWRNIWPLVYGSIFVSTSSLQCFSYYLMYFYNKLTITCNLCHEALCHDLFRDSPIITREFNEGNIAPCASKRWLLTTKTNS